MSWDRRRVFIAVVSVVLLRTVVLADAPRELGQKPAWVPNLNEIVRIVKLRDGKLIAVFLRTTATGPEAAARYSTDDGQTWSTAETLVALAKDADGWGSPEPLVDQAGEIHLFLLKPRKKAAAGIDIDIWHTKSTNGRTKWRAPRRIWEGYTGALNGEIQMKNGRILVPFSYLTRRTWGDRGEDFDAFTYMGTFNCTLVYSDDAGETWHLSPSHLKVTAPDLSTYGAIEPVVVERKDGRVWMLLRTQHGRFYESLSDDGISWSPPRPTRIISSDSPAGLVRLDDGRIVLFWNNCLRFPYAYGGRHVLHAAISADDGRTWHGYREVIRDPRRGKPPPPNGDHGTAYPIPSLGNGDKVIFTTGLPSPKNYNAILNPAWLYETAQKEDFAHGLEEWSAFGVKGIDLVPHPEKSGARVLAVRKPAADWPSGAVWNFPSGVKGSLHMRLLLRPGCRGARIGLTDHFSVPFDELDQFHNLYDLIIGADGRVGAEAKLITGRWHDLELTWDGSKRECQVVVEGKPAAVLAHARASAGVCYLRLRPLAEDVDKAGFLVESVEVKVSAE
jgi:hypothetical protein